MNKFNLMLAALLLLTGLGFYFVPKPASIREEAYSKAGAPGENRSPTKQPSPGRPQVSNSTPVPEAPSKPAAPSVPERASSEDPFLVSAAIGTLVSPQASFTEKQKTWRKLMTSGKLAEAVHELERLVKEDPNRPEHTSVLGQAYMKQCANTQDVREQAILAMKSDQTLEAALSLDPANWDARFTKAMGMSYWPTQMNKGPEVIAQFQTLIQQQEGQPAEPQFALSYSLLGDAYLKNGYPEFATQIWQRGAAQFPGDAELKRKLESVANARN